MTRAFGRADLRRPTRPTPPLTRISVPLVASARARPQHEMRDRRDRRQRLAAEAERRDRREIVGAPDLAGRVALDGQPRIVGLHPLAVVLDADLLLAAELDVNDDAPRAGVDGVLDQLLHDRRRPLDDFAGGNLVGEVASGRRVIRAQRSDPVLAAEERQHDDDDGRP